MSSNKANSADAKGRRLISAVAPDRMKDDMDYSKSCAEFDKTFREAVKLSHDCEGIPSPTGKYFYASVLFTRLCVSAVSLRKLSPDPRLLGRDAHWDYASVCSITRIIVECYLIFHYLCVQTVDDIEWEARWRLFNLHDCSQRTKMFASLDIAPEGEAEKVIEITLDELKANSYFRGLTQKQQRHFLKGNDALFMSQDQIVQSYGGDVNEFRFLYRFLSNQVHSLPMSFYRVSEQERGSGVESEVEVGYTALCLDSTCQYLKQACKDYRTLFQGVEGVRCNN